MAWSNESRQSRGYGRAWELMRLWVLQRDKGLCQCAQCKAENLITPATEVDHIIPKAKGGSDNPENLQAINSECHKRKTIEEKGHTYTPKRVFGLDGYPIEGEGGSKPPDLST